MKKNFYAIKRGSTSNVVVRTWAECSALVTGVSGAIFKGFQKEGEAMAFAGSLKASKPAIKKVKRSLTKKRSKQRGKQYPCIERKSYTDPFTGEFYQDRCVRQFISRVVGVNYVESADSSIPW